MVNTDLTRTIVGIIGNVISFGLFMSPVPTFMKIWKSKSVEEFKPDPYLATVLNCAMWSLYGMPFIQKHNLLVLTINAFGLVVEISYTVIFFVFSPSNKRKKILIVIGIEAIFTVVVVVVTLTCFHKQKDRAVIIGFICIVFNVLMYISPLTVMRRVIKTKSVKYMPFLLSLANFTNGLIWVIYAVLRWDPFIVIPNALGALSGLVQLILYAVYYRTTDWSNDKPAIDAV